MGVNGSRLSCSRPTWVCRHYFDALKEFLAQRVSAGKVSAAEVDCYTLSALQCHYDTAYLDYVRCVMVARLHTYSSTQGRCQRLGMAN